MNFLFNDLFSELLKQKWIHIDLILDFLEELSQLSEKEFTSKHGKGGKIIKDFNGVTYIFHFRIVPGLITFIDFEQKK